MVDARNYTSQHKAKKRRFWFIEQFEHQQDGGRFRKPLFDDQQKIIFVAEHFSLSPILSFEPQPYVPVPQH